MGLSVKHAATQPNPRCYCRFLGFGSTRSEVRLAGVVLKKNMREKSKTGVFHGFSLLVVYLVCSLVGCFIVGFSFLVSTSQFPNCQRYKKKTRHPGLGGWWWMGSGRLGVLCCDHKFSTICLINFLPLELLMLSTFSLEGWVKTCWFLFIGNKRDFGCHLSLSTDPVFAFEQIWIPQTAPEVQRCLS